MNNETLMISDDKNIDELQKTSKINWEQLEKLVDNAIETKDVSLLKISSKTADECRYIQKSAEIYFSLYGILLSIAYSAIAIGLTYMILSYQDNKLWFAGFVGFILVLIGVCLPFVPPRFLTKTKLRSCRRIILDTEQKILYHGSVEPKQEQETNNISFQNQENPLSTDYIKAQLDLSKLKMAGILGGILVLSNSILQTTENDIIYKKLFLFIVLAVLLIWLIRNYIKYSIKLNEK